VPLLPSACDAARVSLAGRYGRGKPPSNPFIRCPISPVFMAWHAGLHRDMSAIRPFFIGLRPTPGVFHSAMVTQRSPPPGQSRYDGINFARCCPGFSQLNCGFLSITDSKSFRRHALNPHFPFSNSQAVNEFHKCVD